MKEVHLFILWENARNKEEEILEDIKKNFNIIGLYNIKWNKDKFSNNLSRFYGTNLPENSGKEQHCGNGDFLLIIVEVENPIYEDRETSKGIQKVNINIFDKKTYYREITGGGHKVHATNSEAETNHDLTLLLGKNTEDYLKENTKNGGIVDIEQDLIGVNGFKTVKEMFYVLNNCINYAIIRNYESLPDEIYLNEHNDIDIICDSCENAAYILNGEKVFPENYRVHYKVKVEDKFAYFDLRHVGDNYYDEKIELEILNKRIFNERGFYTISDELYFYTLMYHAMIHKPELAEDYKKRLIEMNPENILLNSNDVFFDILNEWLINNKYKIVKPNDTSVQFNEFNANELELLSTILEMRKNIISWYPFSKNDSILLLNTNCRNIIQELLQKTGEVVVGNKGLVNINNKFDYIIIIGIENLEESLENTLKNIKHMLKENAKILIAADNKYALNNICKLKNINCSTKNCISSNKYSLKRLISEIEYAGFKNKKIYYPFTDYKFTNVIFTDEKLTDGYNILRNISYNSKSNIKFFNQNDIYIKLLEDNNQGFKEIANSYFIEVFNNEYEENGIKLVSFSNLRKKKYRIKTIVQNDFVYKYAENGSSKLHIQKVKENIDIMKKLNIKTIDSYDDEKIISKYIHEETMDRFILKLLKKNKDDAVKILIKYKNELYEKLEICDKDNNVFDKYKINYDKAIIENMKYTKYGLWDLTFQNCFYIDNEFYFYDQEWREEKVPIDFILYRAIKYLDKKEEYITENELYSLLNITEEKIKLFEELDDIIQKSIRDESIWNIHTQGEDVQKMYIQKLTDNNAINLLNIEIANQNKLIAQKDLELETLHNEINIMKQSKSWKITKPLRKIKKLMK